MWILPSYVMKPSFLNLFMNKLTRDRVVPDCLGDFVGRVCSEQQTFDHNLKRAPEAGIVRGLHAISRSSV